MNKIIKQAFTLIELLVVIAIIGILSGLIIVSMGGMADKATIAKAQVFSNSVRNSLMTDITGEWKFDGTTTDGSLATANDVLDTWNNNNGNIGTHQPTVRTKANCISGSCLDFDGVDDYVRMGTSVQNASNTHSVILFVNPHNAENDYPRIIAFGSIYIMQAATEGYITVQYADGTVNKALSSNKIVIDDGKWSQIGYIFDSSNGKVQLIHNGIFLNSVVHGTVPTNSALLMTIGASPTTTPNYFFDGLIDEVRIYNAAIPTSQIKEQYYAGLNQLLTKGSITQEEYSQRTSELAKK